MPKYLIFVFLFCSVYAFGQVEFEKGYYIDQEGQRVEGFIKNQDWKNNPISFKFKSSLEDDWEELSVQDVALFEIYGTSKYVRAVVDVDRTSNEFQNLTEDQNPIFQSDMLFLKVLIEGKATLYSYREEGLSRFYYSKNKSTIEPLVYKKYVVPANSSAASPQKGVGENNKFRRQLYQLLDCSTWDWDNFRSLNYSYSNLTRIFKEYNECVNENYTVYSQKKRKDIFHLRIRPRLNQSFLGLLYYPGFSNAPPTINDFDPYYHWGVGLEGEFVLPFNKNKWSVLFEPSYTVYEAIDGDENRILRYEYVDFSLGGKYYMFLNERNNIFLTSGINVRWTLDSTLEPTGGVFIFPIEAFNSVFNFGFGATYKSIMVNLVADIGFSKLMELEYSTQKVRSNSLRLSLGYKF